jgi:hypothetical protein
MPRSKHHNYKTESRFLWREIWQIIRAFERVNWHFFSWDVSLEFIEETAAPIDEEEEINRIQS